MIQTPQPSGRRTRGQSLALGVIWCASLAIVTMSSGCSYSNSSLRALSLDSLSCGCCDDLCDRLAARRAWARGYAQCYRRHCATRDVRDGFIDGYVKACNGGDTCPPLFAPESHCMIGGRNRNAAAYFEGYPLGVIAAERCGGCGPATLVNPELLGCGLDQSCNPGCEPCGGVLMGEPSLAPMMPAHIEPEHIQHDQWSDTGVIYDEAPEGAIEPAEQEFEAPAPIEEAVEPEGEPNVEGDAAATDIVPSDESTELAQTVRPESTIEPSEETVDESQAVRLAKPIDWDAVDQQDSSVSPVQFEQR